MVEIWINLLFILLILGAITVTANYADRIPALQVVMIATILGLNTLLVLIPILTVAAASVAEEGDDIAPISDENAAIAIGLAFIISFICTVVLIPQVREGMRVFFPKLQPTSDSTGRAAFSTPMINVIHDDLVEMETVSAVQPTQKTYAGGFNPQSMVHLWAFVLSLYFIASQLVNFFLSDGLSGIAEDIEVNTGLLLSNFLPQIIIPLLGVGIMMRRNVRSVLDRLGIKPVTWKTLVVSAIATFCLLAMVIFISGLWQAMVSEETFERQTEASQALSDSIDTLWLAFFLAFTAGVGEEIAFRGALQPIFGFWFTTIVFVLAHTQYTLTPATLIIFLVTVVFGLIRKYMDTTTAIITHFSYNFIPVALIVAFPEEAAFLLLR